MATRYKWTGNGYEKVQTSSGTIAKENEERRRKSRETKYDYSKKRPESYGIEQATSGPAGGSSTKAKPTGATWEDANAEARKLTGSVSTPELDDATGKPHNAGMPAVQQGAIPPGKATADTWEDANALTRKPSAEPTGNTWEDINAEAGRAARKYGDTVTINGREYLDGQYLLLENAAAKRRKEKAAALDESLKAEGATDVVTKADKSTAAKNEKDRDPVKEAQKNARREYMAALSQVLAAANEDPSAVTPEMLASLYSAEAAKNEAAGGATADKVRAFGRGLFTDKAMTEGASDREQKAFSAGAGIRDVFMNAPAIVSEFAGNAADTFLYPNREREKTGLEPEVVEKAARAGDVAGLAGITGLGKASNEVAEAVVMLEDLATGGRWRDPLNSQAIDDFNRVQQVVAEQTENWTDGQKQAFMYGTEAIRMVPSLILAAMSGGATEAAALGPQAAGRAAEISSALSRYVSGIAHDPQFYLTSIQVTGDSYMAALDAGFDQNTAALFGTLNGILNGALEVGGIQDVPGQIAGKPLMTALLSAAKSVPTEIREEVTQGWVEQALKNIVLGEDNQIISFKDPDAIISGVRALEEGKGAAILTAALGGGSVAINAGVNAYNRAAQTGQEGTDPNAPANRLAPRRRGGGPATTVAEVPIAQAAVTPTQEAPQSESNAAGATESTNPAEVMAQMAQTNQQTEQAQATEPDVREAETSPEQENSVPTTEEVAQAMAPEPQAQEEQPSLSVEEASERVQQYEALADEYEKRFKAWKQANDSGVMDYPYVEENRWLSWAKTTLNSLQSDYTEAQRISRTGNKAVSPDYGTPDNYIGRRTYEEVANRSVKAFQFDHPELHKFFRAEAEKVAEGLDYVPITTVNSKKGTFHTMPNKNPAYLALKPYGLSNEGVSKAMEGVIADRGKENAAAKRAELYLHKRLFNGYIDRNGQRVPPNQEYIEALKKIPGAMEGMWQVERDAEESAMLFDRLSDEERARELAAWEAEHPRPTTQTPAQELASAMTGDTQATSEFNAPESAQSASPAEVMAQVLQGRTAPQNAPQAQTAQAATTAQRAAPAVQQAVQTQAAPEGMKRSQSEANTIQTVDEQVNAPQGVRTPLYYKPVSETESISAARNFLKNGYQSDSAPGKVNSKLSPEQVQALTDAGVRLGGGYGQAMSDMQGSGSWTGVQQDMSTLILEALANDAAATGDWDAYEAWRVVDQQHGEEIARTLQARGKRTRGKAVDILEAVSKTIEDADLSKESRDAAMTKAMPLAQEFQNTPDTDAQALRDIILKVADARKTGTIFKRNLNRLLNKQDAPYLAKLAEASIKGMAADYKPVDIGSKLKSYQTIAQLLKVSTAMRNLGGNESFGILDALVGDTVGQAVDLIAKGFTGARSVAPDARWFSSTQRKAARDALNKSVLEVALDVDMGTVGNKYDPRGRSFRMNGGPGERFMSRLSQILSYSLSSSDALFRGGIEAGTEAGLNRLNAGNEEALKQSRDVAEATADYKLFQNRGTTAQMAKNFHDRLNAMVGTGGKVEGGKRSGGFGLGDLIMPYATVPANLGVKAFEYSPAGIVKGGIDLVKTIKQAKAGKLDLKAQNNAVMEFARGTAGVPLAILFASLIKSGIIKRSDDDDDYDVTKARMAENRKETQWNLDATKRWLQGGSREWQEGDDLVSLNWAEPINAFMDIGSLFSALQDEEDEAGLGDYASNYAYGAIQSFTEMPMIEGLQSAINAMRYTDSDNIGEKLGAFGESTLTSAATGMVPGLVSQAARVMDPVTRDTGGDNMGERFTNALMNAMPGLREQLPEKLDSFGNPIQNDNPLLNALNSTVLPGTVLDYAPNDVVQALEKVYEETGKSNFYPDYKAPNAFTYGGTDYELNTAEKRQWQETYGQKYDELIRATENTKQFENMDPATKAKAYSDIRSMAAAAAKGAIVTARGGEYKSDYDKVNELSDIPSYMATKDIFKDAADPKNGRDYNAINDLMKDYGDLPDDVKKALDTGNTGDLDRLHAAWKSGVSVENWFSAYDAVKELKPVEGKDDVADWQKYQAIANVSSRADADKILKGYMSESMYSRYQSARKAGVDAKTWCGANAGINQIQPAKGNKSRTEWQEYEYIARRYPKQADALLPSFIDSEGMQTRYKTGRDGGISPELWVSYYKQSQMTNGKNDKGESVSGLKKKRMKEWVLSQGYDSKTFDYLYALFNCETKDLAGLNNKYKRKR